MRTTLTLVACIIVALVLCTSVAATQHVAPLGRLLDGYYPRMSDQDEVIIWIYFTDKGVAAQQKMTAAPTTYLSERAIQRRQKALKTTTVIDMQDVPLEQSYVEQVKGMVRKFRHEVKWFNAASAIATKSQIELIRRLPFVSEVDAVVRYRTAKIAAQEPSTFSPPVYPANPETTFSYGGSLTQNQQINTPPIITSLTPNMVLGSRGPAVAPKCAPVISTAWPGSISAGVTAVIVGCTTVNVPADIFFFPAIISTGPDWAWKGTFTSIRSDSHR